MYPSIYVMFTTAGLLGLVAAYFLCDECGGLKLQEIDGVSFIGHIGFGKVSSVCRSVSCLSRFALRMRAILLLCQSVGHISEVLK